MSNEVKKRSFEDYDCDAVLDTATKRRRQYDDTELAIDQNRMAMIHFIAGWICSATEQESHPVLFLEIFVLVVEYVFEGRCISVMRHSCVPIHIDTYWLLNEPFSQVPKGLIKHANRALKFNMHTARSLLYTNIDMKGLDSAISFRVTGDSMTQRDENVESLIERDGKLREVLSSDQLFSAEFPVDIDTEIIACANGFYAKLARLVPEYKSINGKERYAVVFKTMFTTRADPWGLHETVKALHDAKRITFPDFMFLRALLTFMFPPNASFDAPLVQFIDS